jgi:hypothetical protein
MMIRLYEVRFHLENGSALNVLMAAGSADEAKGFAHSTLQAASRPVGSMSVITATWKWDEITVTEVSITELQPA